MLVQDMYNKLAVIAGFPLYTNDTDTPDTQRLLISVLSSALQNVIDGLYITNNVFERTDTITTTPSVSQYGIDGIIKNIQYKDKHGKYQDIKYINGINFHSNNLDERKGEPEGYVIKDGYVKLVPVPDNNYEVVITVSTTDLVLSNNDTARETIEDINDSVVASDRFCEIVVLRAAQIIFMKANNINAQVYADLVKERIKTFIEHDYKSFEAKRTFTNKGGNFDPRRGLLG